MLNDVQYVCACVCMCVHTYVCAYVRTSVCMLRELLILYPLPEQISNLLVALDKWLLFCDKHMSYVIYIVQ